jgi:hypothetical protein
MPFPQTQYRNPLLDEEDDPFAQQPDEGEPDDFALAGIPDVPRAPAATQAPLPTLPAVRQGDEAQFGGSNGLPPSSPDDGVSVASQRLRDILRNPPPDKKPGILNRIGAAAVGAGAGWNNANPRLRPVDVSQTMQNILYPGKAQQEQRYKEDVALSQADVAAEQNRALNTAKVGELGARSTAEQQRAKAEDERAKAEIARALKLGQTSFDRYAELMKIPGMTKDRASALAATGKEPVKDKGPTGLVQVNDDLGKKLGLQPNEKGEYWAPSAAIGANLKVDNPPPPKPQYDPNTRAALVATGAADPDNPTSIEMEKALRRVEQLHVSERPPASGEQGTWTLQEDAEGKPVLLNSKTGETKPATGVQKSGSKAKADAATEKEIGPARDALAYAQNYVQNGVFTGSGDEALQEKFFELAKPTTGFRMTQPQMDMLQQSRGWMGSAAAKLRHVTTGTWFSDDQRKQIVQTMQDLANAKLQVAQHAGHAQSQPAPQPGAGRGGNPNPNGYVKGHVYGGLTYLGGDPSQPSSWKQ